MPFLNSYGQPVGPPLPSFKPPPAPSAATILHGPVTGCKLEPLDPARHGESLSKNLWEGTMNDHWTYLPYHRPSSRAEFDAWLQERRATRPDPFIYAIVDSHGEAQGIIAYLNGSPKNGSIETGHVLFGPNLQHTKLATEAQCALAKHAFEDLGYKRLEWKCDSLNVHSKRAAERLGYSYEGLFRSHWIYKGRGRDTIWLAMVDYDWPVIKRGFETWLAPENFDKHSRQVRNLEACRKQAVTDMKANENAP